MESYLIRIYRRNKENPEAIIGMIEEIGTKEKHSFKNLSELDKIICPAIKKDELVKSSADGARRKCPWGAKKSG